MGYQGFQRQSEADGATDIEANGSDTDRVKAIVGRTHTPGRTQRNIKAPTEGGTAADEETHTEVAAAMRRTQRAAETEVQ